MPGVENRPVFMYTYGVLNHPLTKENQMPNTDYNAFEGFQVQGKAAQVYLKGNLAAEDGTIVKEKMGRFVRRKRRMASD